MFTSMESIKFCVYKEAPYYVAHCLNVDIPAGRREIPRGTLGSIIRQSGLPEELFN